jgi:hypothetical protein
MLLRAKGQPRRNRLPAIEKQRLPPATLYFNTDGFNGFYPQPDFKPIDLW